MEVFLLRQVGEKLVKDKEDVNWKEAEGDPAQQRLLLWEHHHDAFHSDLL